MPNPLPQNKQEKKSLETLTKFDWELNNSGGLVPVIDYEKSYTGKEYEILVQAAKDLNLETKGKNFENFVIVNPSQYIMENLLTEERNKQATKELQDDWELIGRQLPSKDIESQKASTGASLLKGLWSTGANFVQGIANMLPAKKDDNIEEITYYKIPNTEMIITSKKLKDKNVRNAGEQNNPKENLEDVEPGFIHNPNIYRVTKPVGKEETKQEQKKKEYVSIEKLRAFEYEQKKYNKEKRQAQLAEYNKEENTRVHKNLDIKSNNKSVKFADQVETRVDPLLDKADRTEKLEHLKKISKNKGQNYSAVLSKKYNKAQKEEKKTFTERAQQKGGTSIKK
jgi:hypothetical protein